MASAGGATAASASSAVHRTTERIADGEEEEEKYAAASSVGAAVLPSPSAAVAMDFGGDDEADLAATLAGGGGGALSQSATAAFASPRMMQSALPASYRPAPASGPFTSLRPASSSPGSSSGALLSGSTVPPRRDDKLVRTDNRQGKMDSFFTQTQSPSTSAAGASSADDRGRKRPHAAVDGGDADEGVADSQHTGAVTSSASYPAATAAALPAASSSTSSSRRVRPAPPILLTSVQNLLSSIASASHPQLHELLSAHTYVGFVSPAYSLVQHRTKLYLLNVTNLSRSFFYQTALRYFGHHPLLLFERPLPLRKLIRMALAHPSQAARSLPAQRDALADEYTELLLSRAAMLKEYFALSIESSSGETDEEAAAMNEDGGAGADAAAAQSPLDQVQLLGIPELAEHYNPPLLLLPLFLLQLARDCNWNSEQECFESVAHCLAEFYKLRKESLYLTPKQPQPNAAKDGASASAASSSTTLARPGGAAPLPSLSWWVPNVLFPLLRHRSSFAPPASAATDGSVTQVAALENLYKIFERC
jgi:DNA mismatch repair protein MLH1